MGLTHNLLGRLHNRYFLLVLTLTALAAVPRFYNLGGPSFWNDEGDSTLFSLAVLSSGLPILPGHPETFIAVNFDPLYPYLEALSFKLLGISQYSARLPAAIAGTLLVPVGFIMGSKLRGQLTGLALSVLLAFSTEYIAWSRQARGYIVLTLLIAAAFAVAACLPEARRSNAGRWYYLLLGGIATLIVLSSPGLAILYVPGAIGSLIVYDALAHPERIPRFFGFKNGLGDPFPLNKDITFRSRRWLLGILVVTVIVAMFRPPSFIGGPAGALFRAALHFSPYPFTLNTSYLSYLSAYYPWVLAFGALGSYVSIQRRNPLEIAALTFLILNVASLSSIISYVVNVPGGAPLYERYLTPLLVLLFYFASVGILTALRVIYRSFASVRRAFPLDSTSKPPILVLGVVLAITVPSVVFPSAVTVYPSAVFSGANNTVAWAPFDPFPPFPSALYDTEQPNYALACTYISHHRASGDVAAAIWPDAPTFYLGKVQYWIFSNPPPGAATTVNGIREYFLTGSLEISNLSQLESLMFNTSGWFILDLNSQGAVGNNMSLAVDFLMQSVPAASDSSETLYHWTRLNVDSLLSVLLSHRPDLQLAFGNNTTELIDWAATYGVTAPSSRGILLPIEASLVNMTNNATRPLAVLIQVFNQQTDLQKEFPEVENQENFTGLLHWADEVVSGQISNPAYSTLEPYASYYERF